VIVLRYYEDLTERETAEIPGVAVGTGGVPGPRRLPWLRVLLPGLHLDAEEVNGSAPVAP
jgi:DNA-directed RNA polymerase specialized sigma24 family protein